jgi:hypothetical protein
MKKRYNFDRYRGEQLMAEGIAVHANDPDEALIRAKILLGADRGETLRFRDNDPCPAGFFDCFECHPLAPTASGTGP